MKSLFGFGFPFFIRVLVPGLFASVAILPFYKFILVAKFPSDTDYFAVTATVFGLIATFMGDHIYRVLEGYLCWPNWLRKRCTQRLNDKIQRLYGRYRATTDAVEKRVIEGYLNRFPLKEDARENEPWNLAEMPTMLGNILRSYESYPKSRYGIRSIYFWPVFWLSLDKDTRKEIDELWVFADCLTYVSLTSLVLGFAYLLLFVFDATGVASNVLLFMGIQGAVLINLGCSAKYVLYFGMALCLFFASRLSYLLSLRHHMRNGGFYEAIFALKKDEIREKLAMRESDRLFWDEMWSYLKYKLIKCSKCQKYFTDQELQNNKCDTCRQELQVQQEGPSIVRCGKLQAFLLALLRLLPWCR